MTRNLAIPDGVQALKAIHDTVGSWLTDFLMAFLQVGISHVPCSPHPLHRHFHKHLKSQMLRATNITTPNTWAYTGTAISWLSTRLTVSLEKGTLWVTLRWVPTTTGLPSIWDTSEALACKRRAVSALVKEKNLQSKKILIARLTIPKASPTNCIAGCAIVEVKLAFIPLILSMTFKSFL